MSHKDPDYCLCKRALLASIITGRRGSGCVYLARQWPHFGLTASSQAYRPKNARVLFSPLDVCPLAIFNRRYNGQRSDIWHLRTASKTMSISISISCYNAVSSLPRLSTRFQTIHVKVIIYYLFFKYSWGPASDLLLQVPPGGVEWFWGKQEHRLFMGLAYYEE